MKSWYNFTSHVLYVILLFYKIISNLFLRVGSSPDVLLTTTLSPQHTVSFLVVTLVPCFSSSITFASLVFLPCQQ